MCNVIPNFLRFCVSNKPLKDSVAYSGYQQLMLKKDIRKNAYVIEC